MSNQELNEDQVARAAWCLENTDNTMASVKRLIAIEDLLDLGPGGPFGDEIPTLEELIAHLAVIVEREEADAAAAVDANAQNTAVEA